MTATNSSILQHLSAVHNDNGILATMHCPANITEVVRECYRSYVQAYDLDVDISGKLPLISNFTAALKPLYESVQKTCRPYNNLHKCIRESTGANPMSDCLSLRLYLALTAKFEDGYQYLYYFGEFEYMCGEGYKVFRANEQCLAEVKKNETIEKQLNFCKSQTYGMNPADICNTSLTRTRCALKEMERACGNDVADALCALVYNTALYFAPLISSNCAKHFKAECNEHLYDGQSTSQLFTGRFTSPSSTGQFTSPSFAGQSISPSFVGRPTSPSSAGRPTPLSPEGRFTSPSSSGQFISPSSTGQFASPSFVRRPTPLLPAARPTPLLPAARFTPRSPDGRSTPPSSSGRSTSPSSAGWLITTMSILCQFVFINSALLNVSSCITLNV
ncbi:unnamed protein product [Anisakis simplex]|uniref:DUF19 domain-containing protein n=1 Tax=Anisakis simplex TaxID=6269 RepID=A0A0M3JZM8_ANISI|nr:unnamed protein product [Anisakis simplex]